MGEEAKGDSSVRGEDKNSERTFGESNSLTLDASTRTRSRHSPVEW